MASPSSLPPLPDAQMVPSLNHPLLAALISFAVAQGLKVLTTRPGAHHECNLLFLGVRKHSLSLFKLEFPSMSVYKEQHWDATRLLGSGGMPSSHAAIVMGLVASVGLNDGPGGSLFAIAVVLASVVMYDASGVRLQAGNQAKVLNQIVIDLPPEHPLSESTPLRELLGHTPLQVIAGGILGCLVALFLQIVFYGGSYRGH